MNRYIIYNESQRYIIPVTTGFIQLVSFCMPCHLLNKLLFSKKEEKKKEVQISWGGLEDEYIYLYGFVHTHTQCHANILSC